MRDENDFKLIKQTRLYPTSVSEIQNFEQTQMALFENILMCSVQDTPDYTTLSFKELFFVSLPIALSIDCAPDSRGFLRPPFWYSLFL